MNKSINLSSVILATSLGLSALPALSGLLGCVNSSPAPSGTVVSAGGYNYSPSVLQSGDERKFWWCGQAINPSDNKLSDTILYQAFNTTTQQTASPQVVLAETAGSWDAAFTCNPRVIGGSFVNPLGDGDTYTYALYYVATANFNGINNSIGVAFSNDGIAWKKYPSPVLNSTSGSGYGIGQPVLYNRDGKSSLIMIYEDNTPTTHHVEATSVDGIHFTVLGSVTTNGMESGSSWGDAGYDPVTGYWYAVFDLNTREQATTGGIAEYGQYGFQLYRIPATALLTGSKPWQLVQVVDTNLTGYEENFLPGMLHDGFGNLNTGPYPMLQLYPSISNPQPAWNATPLAVGQSGDISKWVIGSYLVNTQPQPLALNRYSNLITYEVTTGWVDPSSGFKVHDVLGHLYQTPQNGATRPFYGCKSGTTDYFVSLDVQCEGEHLQGLEGFGYAVPVAGLNLVPLYRCSTGGPSTFVSNQANCEERGPGTLLGYALP